MSVKVPARQYCYLAAGGDVGAWPARARGWSGCSRCSSVSVQPQAGATRTLAPHGRLLLVVRVRLYCAATRTSSRTERALGWPLTRGRLRRSTRWVRLKHWGRSRTRRRSRAWLAACRSLRLPASPSRESSRRRRGTIGEEPPGESGCIRRRRWQSPYLLGRVSAWSASELLHGIAYV